MTKPDSSNSKRPTLFQPDEKAVPDSFSVLDAATVQGSPRRKSNSATPAKKQHSRVWLVTGGIALSAIAGGVAWLMLSAKHDDPAPTEVVAAPSPPVSKPISPPPQPARPPVDTPTDAPVVAEPAAEEPADAPAADPTTRLESVLTAKEQPTAQPEDELTEAFSSGTAVVAGAAAAGVAAAAKTTPAAKNQKDVAKAPAAHKAPTTKPSASTKAAPAKPSGANKSSDAELLREEVISHLEKAERQKPASKPR
ncbi:type IV secretory pathway VirB10-like protein [Chitinivorax tropicus]|uniref:Type IV secretory pathway VirB10-like protein n=1 Tax=Chitinivorax tropicus TaxID=714531 RepID=A0A840MLG7_9PROT|nr:hypothetical protein [Chitinivorax tropicus]MBB5017727.1 type IV secretory pathway VirB10-like protein [Chitinivorax tropicus]